MNVKEIVVAEFNTVFERHGYSTTPEFLRVAETPFDLSAVQRAVDRDLQQIEEQARFLSGTESQRRVREKERIHEEQLRQLSRQYAVTLLTYTRQGIPINEARASAEQANLKAQAGRGCDVYPCSQQLRAR